MEKYERISPGAADRILAMAEKEQAHRHEQEEKENAVNSHIAESNIARRMPVSARSSAGSGWPTALALSFWVLPNSA